MTYSENKNLFLTFVAKSRGQKTDSWQVKPKIIPAWEQEEILEEQKFASNGNFSDRKC